MEGTTEKKIRKNPYIDALKGIACLIVVFLHCPFPGVIGDGIIYGLRFSVPVFFMISGYYSYHKTDEWILNKAKYILKLLFFSEVFYGIWTYVFQCLIQQKSFDEVFVEKFKHINVIQTIFFGSVFNGTLWYLYAIFWTWLLIFLFRKIHILSKLYFLIPVLLVVQVFGRAYVQNNYDIEKYVVWFRNVLTFGVPFTLLGTWIAQYQNNLLNKISERKNILIIVGGFFLIVLEFLLYGKYMDTHISTIVIAFGLFLYAIRQQRELNKYLTGFAYIGARWSMWIYLVHMFVSQLLHVIFTGFHLEGNAIFKYSKPVLVCVAACVISELLVRMKVIKCAR